MATSMRAAARRLRFPRVRGRSAGPGPLTRLRRDPPPEHVALLATAGVALVLLLLNHQLGSRWVPPGTEAVPLLLAGLLLGRRSFRRLAVVVGVCVVSMFVLETSQEAPPGSVFVVVATGMIAYEFARYRDETGLGGLRGDSVLVELRRRLELQGLLPALPVGWGVESVVSPAGGGPFAGDFVVSAHRRGRFEVALVDVSGKGVDAGTRALLLSGAMGGLLGSSASTEFLEASNSYLVRQDWDEGFATAVHVDVDLVTGGFVVGSAGHPPVAHFDAGSGRWRLLSAAGPALGLLPDVVYDAVTGTLRPGDALLLYTDGLVEVPGRDLTVGIDKLLGEAERIVMKGFCGGGQLLVDRVAHSSSDDRGLVLLWRDR